MQTPSCLVQVEAFKNQTRGQRPNVSQKAVIIDMMKSVGEISSKIWPVIYYLTHFGEILTLTFDLRSLDAHLWVDLGTKYELSQ